MRTLYWSQGGVRPLTIIFINADVLRLVSSEYGRKITKGMFTLKIHSCGSCVLYLFCWRGTEDRPCKPREDIIPRVLLQWNLPKGILA